MARCNKLIISVTFVVSYAGRKVTLFCIAHSALSLLVIQKAKKKDLFHKIVMTMDRLDIKRNLKYTEHLRQQLEKREREREREHKHEIFISCKIVYENLSKTCRFSVEEEVIFHFVTQFSFCFLLLYLLIPFLDLCENFFDAKRE
jgi:hypothetical protein